MTREQALNYLYSSGFSEGQVNAVVEALTYTETPDEYIERCKECGEIKPCGDTISRSEAIDQIEQAYNILDATDRIKALPSVQAVSDETIAYNDDFATALEKISKYEDKVVSGDAISREAVIEKLNEWDWQELYLPVHFKEHIIDELPSVTPSRLTEHKPICDDCIYFDNGKGSEKCDSCELTGTNKPSRRKGHWIDVKDQMPEPLQAVIVTWKNHMPEPYYSDIKHKPFVGVAIYYRDKWWWWSAYTEDMLAEYGRSDSDKVDDAIEITAWMPLPKADMRGDTDAVN